MLPKYALAAGGACAHSVDKTVWNCLASRAMHAPNEAANG